MEFCFTCKTTAVKTTDSFCSNCGSKQPSNVESTCLKASNLLFARTK